jgi:hypothetical protein
MMGRWGRIGIGNKGLGARAHQRHAVILRHAGPKDPLRSPEQRPDWGAVRARSLAVVAQFHRADSVEALLRRCLDVRGRTHRSGELDRSQHCDRGHPREAPRGQGASGVSQPTRTAGRRQRPLRGTVFHNVGGTPTAVESSIGPNIVTGGTHGKHPGDRAPRVSASRREQQAEDSAFCGVPPFTMLGPHLPQWRARSVPTL